MFLYTCKIYISTQTFYVDEQKKEIHGCIEIQYSSPPLDYRRIYLCFWPDFLLGVGSERRVLYILSPKSLLKSACIARGNMQQILIFLRFFFVTLSHQMPFLQRYFSGFLCDVVHDLLLPANSVFVVLWPLWSFFAFKGKKMKFWPIGAKFKVAKSLA